MAFEIFSGAVFEPTKLGRPFDERLAELDDEAARAVIAERFANSREAAKHYAPKYAGRAFEDFSAEAKHNKLKDVERRIERRRKTIVSA